MNPLPPIADSRTELVLRRLEARIREFPEIGEQPVRADTRFDDLGLDSVDLLELLVWVEDEFGVALPDRNLHAPTLGELVSNLCDRLEAKG